MRAASKNWMGRLLMAVVMGVIVVSFAIAVPSLLLKKCPRCGARNGLDARSCRNCQAPFADAEP